MTTPHVQPLEAALFELERELWLRAGDVDFYREKLTADAVMVFPAPFGIVDRQTVLDAVDRATNWTSVTIDERRLLALTDESAVLAYRASGTREGEPPYTTYATSVFVHSGGEWKLALHQQTPIRRDAA